MTTPEFKPEREAPCLNCPRRTAARWVLARLGIEKINEDCPGPNVVTRFDTVAVEPGAEAPKGYTFYGTLGGVSVSGMSIEAVQEYYRTPVRKEKVCFQDEIVVGDEEIVATKEISEDGRMKMTVVGGEANPTKERDLRLLNS